MKKYCAFLRGINIGGKTMKMMETCDALKAAGLADATSVLATGNLIFTSERPQDELRGFLEQILSEHYKDSVNLFIKNVDETLLLLKSVPFEENAETHIYTFICESGFENILLDEFKKITPSDKEAAMINNSFFYWQCRKGTTLDSGFSKILSRKNMKDKFTSRNISTISKVVAKLEGLKE